jgi:hypothetical protein
LGSRDLGCHRNDPSAKSANVLAVSNGSDTIRGTGVALDRGHPTAGWSSGKETKMGTHRAPSNRRGTTIGAGVLVAGALLFIGPAATALADETGTPAVTTKAVAQPDYSIGGFLNNAGQFAGHLGTNAEQFIGKLGSNGEQFLGTLGTNGGQFVGKLGTNTLIFAGTLGNNLVGNPPNAGGGASTAMNVSAQCVATGSGTCKR